MNDLLKEWMRFRAMLPEIYHSGIDSYMIGAMSVWLDERAQASVLNATRQYVETLGHTVREEAA